MKNVAKFLALSAACLVAGLASQADAGWGRYRVTTYYGTPSVPVVMSQGPVIQSAYYAPVVVGSPFIAPAPLPVYSAPVVQTYYAPAAYAVPAGPPVVNIYRPALPARYFRAPPGALFVTPPTRTYYYPGTIILP